MVLQAEVIENLQNILVKKLRLPVQPAEIDPAMELFNAGLGLDSVDSLELVAAIHEEYGVELTSEHMPHFKNLNSLSQFVCGSLTTTS